MRIVVGDITKLSADAIVTSANESLLGGGGVDGAVHRAAGPGLLEECERIGICPEGEARITKGYRLPTVYIIHAVGPVYEGGQFGEAKVLASAYKAALALAEKNNVETVAFPCISTGVYDYPNEEACKIAVGTVEEWLNKHELPRLVTFCCFDQQDADLYQKRLNQVPTPA